MMGEGVSVVKELWRSLKDKGYKLSMVGVVEEGVLYASAKSNGVQIDIGRRFFNTQNSEFFIDVKCGRKPTNDLIDKLNNSQFPSSCSRNWGKRPSRHLEQFSYLIKYGLPTRTEPKDISSSLSKTMSTLVKVLQS